MGQGMHQRSDERVLVTHTPPGLPLGASKCSTTKRRRRYAMAPADRQHLALRTVGGGVGGIAGTSGSDVEARQSVSRRQP